MTNDQFTIKYVETEGFRQAYGLWRAYNLTTEEYDRSVCFYAQEDGTAMPVTPQERRLSSQYAQRILKEIIDEARRLQIPENDFLVAQSEVYRRSYDYLRKELDCEIKEEKHSLPRIHG